MKKQNLVSKILPLISRRAFMKSTAATTALTASGLAAAPARADTLPRVEQDGAMARALNYVYNAQSVVDTVLQQLRALCRRSRR